MRHWQKASRTKSKNWGSLRPTATVSTMKPAGNGLKSDPGLRRLITSVTIIMIIIIFIIIVQRYKGY